MLGWIGLALLSGSWLFGVEYYHRTEPRVWMLLVGLGAVLPGHAARAAIAAHEYGDGPAVGKCRGPLLAQRHADADLPHGDRLSDALARRRDGAADGPRHSFGRFGISNAIVRVGSLQDVHGPIARITESLAQPAKRDCRPLGHPVLRPRFNGCHLLDVRRPHAGATWELLLDPVTFLFIVGGIVIVLWQRGPDSLTQPSRWRWVGGPLKLLALAAVWLPIPRVC